MGKISIGGKEYITDEGGFLSDPEDWNEEIAVYFANKEGISHMTEEHWKLVNFIREYYQDNKIAPMIRIVTKNTGFTVKKIYDLFPSGPAKGACKVAGLPKPTGCV